MSTFCGNLVNRTSTTVTLIGHMLNGHYKETNFQNTPVTESEFNSVDLVICVRGLCAPKRRPHDTISNTPIEAGYDCIMAI